jgi:hypothetical protein
MANRPSAESQLGEDWQTPELFSEAQSLLFAM